MRRAVDHVVTNHSTTGFSATRFSTTGLSPTVIGAVGAVCSGSDGSDGDDDDDDAEVDDNGIEVAAVGIRKKSDPRGSISASGRECRAMNRFRCTSNVPPDAYTYMPEGCACG